MLLRFGAYDPGFRVSSSNSPPPLQPPVPIGREGEGGGGGRGRGGNRAGAENRSKLRGFRGGGQPKTPGRRLKICSTEVLSCRAED